ncbi:hypothetical protein SEA_DIZZYRUDY_82 [Microbacterium phage DizzyRudy]|nr:hypothetical protein SEA_DIZZYRUDY_82 [Microbacterium phage DizzyRudy]WMI34515.1 hypothetical protein SEA_DAMASCUS_78 [Microbacterium phage Damascus]
MTDIKPSISDRVKSHFSNNKQTYRDFAMYSLGVAATATTLVLLAKVGGKSIDAKWDAAQAKAVAELGEEAIATTTREGQFMFILPFDTKEALMNSQK